MPGISVGHWGSQQEPYLSSLRITPYFGMSLIMKKLQKGIQKIAAQRLIEDRLHSGKKKEAVLFPVASTAGKMPKSYAGFLSDLKKRIQ